MTLLHRKRSAVEDELGREFAVHCTTRTLDECVAASALVRRMQTRAYARSSQWS